MATMKCNPKRASTSCKAKSGHFNQTMEQEVERERFGSQQFLELVKYGSKSEDCVKKANGYFQGFKSVINSQSADLHNEINHQEAQSSSRDIEFSNHFGLAFSPILRNNAIIQPLEKRLTTDASRSCNLLHQRCREVLIGAASLYEQLQKSYGELATQQPKSVVDTDWEEDMQKVKHILDSGRQIGEQKMESIITGMRNPLFDAQTAEISRILYDNHHGINSDLTWDQVTRKQEKAMMRLINTLPWE